MNKTYPDFHMPFINYIEANIDNKNIIDCYYQPKT